MNLFPIVTISFAALLTSCGNLQPNAVTRLGSDPILSGGTYTSGGGITVAADIRNDNGYTQICGVWAQSRHQSVFTNRVEHNVLGSGAVYLGNEAVIRGLVFMTEVDPADNYTGQTAGCIRTERPWRAGDETKTAQIRFPRQVVHVEGGGFAGSLVVYFRPTGPGAGGSR